MSDDIVLIVERCKFLGLSAANRRDGLVGKLTVRLRSFLENRVGDVCGIFAG